MGLAAVSNALVVAVIIVSVSTVHATGNRIQRNGLNGPVKSVVGRVAYYRLKSGKLTEQCCSTLYSFTFDRNGQVLSCGPVTPPIDPGPIGPKPPKKSLYNERAEIIGEEVLSSDGSVYSRTTFLFDDNHNKIGEKTHSAIGRLINEKVYSPDGRHHLIEEITYMFNGKPYGRWTYDSYDSYDN